MKLETFLHKHKISRTDFAQAIGVTEASICRYISAQRMPRLSVLSKITAATKGEVTPNDFVEQQPAKTSEAAQ